MAEKLPCFQSEVRCLTETDTCLTLIRLIDRTAVFLVAAAAVVQCLQWNLFHNGFIKSQFSGQVTLAGNLIECAVFTHATQWKAMEKINP